MKKPNRKKKNSQMKAIHRKFNLGDLVDVPHMGLQDCIVDQVHWDLLADKDVITYLLIDQIGGTHTALEGDIRASEHQMHEFIAVPSGGYECAGCGLDLSDWNAETSPWCE